MALIKEIEQPDGMITNYHRVVYVQKIINKCNIIQVASYVKETKRDFEKENIENGKETENDMIYIHKEIYRTDYDENMTPENAYEFLKTLKIFKDAENA
jgi:hypothetical protein